MESTADPDHQACHVHGLAVTAAVRGHTTADPGHVLVLTILEVDPAHAVILGTGVVTEEAVSEADTTIEELITNRVSKTREIIPEVDEAIITEILGTTIAITVAEADRTTVTTEEDADLVVASREAVTGITEIVDMIGVDHVIAAGLTVEAGNANLKIP